MMKSLNFFFCLFSFLILTNCSFFDSDKIDLLPFLQKEKWGYIDLQGKIVINPQFTTANYFNEGLALVSTGDKYGYIDKTGKYVINPSFIKATDFSEGVAFVVKENTEPKAINKKGETKFSIKVKSGSILVVSYIGYKTQEVKAARNMIITLQEKR